VVPGWRFCHLMIRIGELRLCVGHESTFAHPAGSLGVRKA
jgi:hypothetical protein